MKFRPISTYHPPLERPDSIRSLVNDFRVVTWTVPPLSLETMLRCMRHGRAWERYSDRRYGVGSRYIHGVIDHAYAFKCDVGAFLLTMPYNTHEGFYKDFSSLMNVHAGYFGSNPTDDIHAQIVNDRYKTRENGDFAAIIATIDVLDVLRGRMHS